LSYVVTKYQRQSPNAVTTTQIASFYSNAEADAYANERNGNASIEGENVWYEAHPESYSEVSWQPPTPGDIARVLADLKAQYDSLRITAELYQSSRGRATVLLYLGLSVLLGFVIGTPGWILAREFYFPPVFALAGIILVVASFRDFRRATENELKREQWLFLRAYRVLQNLNDYLNGKTSFPHFKKKAQDELRVLVSRIENRWAIGEFELAKNALTSLKLLKEGLRQRLLRAVEDEEIQEKAEKEKLELCQQNMIEFCSYLLKKEPQLADVNRLNSLLWLLPPRVEKKGRWRLLSEWFKVNFKIRLMVPFILSLASGPILFALATSTNVASGSAALQPAVGASVGFTGIYATVWAYRNRDKKKSE